MAETTPEDTVNLSQVIVIRQAFKMEPGGQRNRWKRGRDNEPRHLLTTPSLFISLLCNFMPEGIVRVVDMDPEGVGTS